MIFECRYPYPHRRESEQQILLKIIISRELHYRKTNYIDRVTITKLTKIYNDLSEQISDIGDRYTKG